MTDKNRVDHVEREAVARVLAAHRSWPNVADGCIGCGWKPDRADFAGRKHALHVADAVLAALPQTRNAVVARVEALILDLNADAEYRVSKGSIAHRIRAALTAEAGQ